MRPPVSVVVPGLRARETHRLPTVYEYDRRLVALDAQIVRRGDTGNTGTDDRYINFLISLRDYRNRPFL